MLLNTLIFLYGAILVISTLMSFYLWRIYRHQLILNLVQFWITGIFSYFAQGIFQDLDTLGLLSFSSNIFTIYLFLKIYSEGSDLNLPLNKYAKILVSSVLLSQITMLATHDFRMSAFVFCLICSGVILHATTIQLQGKQLDDGIVKGYRALLIFDAIHFLDFAFVRTNPQLSVIGFSITLIFFFCFAVFVPMFILRKISMDYTLKLESQVKIRTQELQDANLKLSIAIESIKDSKEEIENLLQENRSRLSTVVHDISNPLQIIFSHISILLNYKDKFFENFSERQNRLQIAMNNTKQILSEAKNSHSVILGKKSVSLNNVNLSHVLSEIASMFEDSLKNKNLHLDIDVDAIGHDQCLLASEPWLKNQVLANLISNAIKFSNPHGRILIKGSLINGHIVISVIDHGQGIEDTLKPHLFDFKKMTTNSGTHGEQGTGLGLPIVKQYTELMGGKILVKDSMPHGACFEIHLKAAA